MERTALSRNRRRLGWVGLAAGLVALAMTGADSKKETSPVPTTHAEHTNRLAREKSPYLLQHAHNPVDWYPWGEEAFARAKAEDKPIFLSIGYSTCHWCHVMERESFENEEIAAFLNEHFVPIKVDREERPDVDQVYMQAVTAITGQGGWPLSAFLTPDGRPFWGGTYFPPDDRYGRPGFPTVLARLSEMWTARRADLLQSADRLRSHLEEQSRLPRPEAGGELGEALGPGLLARGVEQFAASFDSALGGFGRAPKFPRSHTLSFLLAAHARGGEPEALRMVEVTLDQMARGGIHDHLGGGFHRYSTDARWLVPHFEKMLYDQALLARTYLEAYQVTGEAEYAAVARDIFAYVERDMTAPEGGFYSAEDADSEGEEGKFYVWTPEEVKAVLGPDEGAFFAGVYDVTSEGNFEGGRSILNLKRRLAAVAAEPRTEVEELESRLAADRLKLLAARRKRVRPHLDDKILTDWNGLMIGALALGARVLGEPAYREAAERAADFAWRRLRRADGRLLKRWRAGEAAIPGYLDDYAFLAWGQLELYGATFDPEHLERARTLARDMVRLFRDAEGGGFYFAGTDAESLIVRTQEIYDGAVPSGNAIAALVLLRLGDLTADPELGRQGRETVDAFAAALAASPTAFPQLLLALDFALGPTTEVVLAGDPGSPDLRAMLAGLDRRFLPRTVVAVRPPGAAGERMVALAPFLAAHEARDGRATAYVCRNYACSLPTSDPAAMLAQLEQMK